MKIKIVAVGKLKERYFIDAAEEYKKRISRYCKVEIAETEEYLFKGEPSFAEQRIIRQKEGEGLLSRKEGYVLAMDSRGKEFTDEELAAAFSRLKLSHNVFTFYIGGSYGLSEEVKNNADVCVSFGKITLPHQLMRVVLLEQIYRVLSIDNNTKYHK